MTDTPLTYQAFSAPTQCLDVLIKAKLQEHYDFLVQVVARDKKLREDFGLEEDFREIEATLGGEVEFFVNSPAYYTATSQEKRNTANHSKEHVALVKQFRDKVAAKIADKILPGTERYKGGLSAEGRALLESRTRPSDLNGIIDAYHALARAANETAKEEGVRLAPHSLHIHLSLQQGGKRNLLYNPDAKSLFPSGLMLSGALTSSVDWGTLEIWERARPLCALPDDLVPDPDVKPDPDVEPDRVLGKGMRGIQYKFEEGMERVEARFNTRAWAMHPELSLLLIFAGIRHGIESAETGDVLTDSFTLDMPFEEAFSRMKKDPVLVHYLGADLHKGLCEIVQHYPKVQAGEISPDDLAEQMRNHPVIKRINAKAKYCGVPLSPVRLPIVEKGVESSRGWNGRFPDKNRSNGTPSLQR